MKNHKKSISISLKWSAIATLIATALASQSSYAQDVAGSVTEAQAKIKNETEVSIVQVGGNASSESYSLKQKSTLEKNKYLYTLTARYLESKSASTLTAKGWEVAIRAERSFTENLSGYLSQGAESDQFAGFYQRDNTDLGAKYKIFTSEEQNLISELGYRYTRTRFTTDETSNASFARVYLEYVNKISKGAQFKFWVEYLPNFTDSEAYLANAEPSLSVVLTEVFSLKTSYLIKYHNKTLSPGEKKTDTSFTTAIVAVF